MITSLEILDRTASVAPQPPLTIPASHRSGQVKTCYCAPVGGSWRWIYYPCNRLWLTLSRGAQRQAVGPAAPAVYLRAPISTSGSQVAISGKMQRITIASIMQTT